MCLPVSLNTHYVFVYTYVCLDQIVYVHTAHRHTHTHQRENFSFSKLRIIASVGSNYNESESCIKRLTLACGRLQFTVA